MASYPKQEYRVRRHWRIRKKVSGTAAVPRMAVCTTAKHIYVQFIDDEQGHTLAQASTLDKELRGKVKCNNEGALAVAKLAVERAQQAGISQAVFDRGGFNYHGRVKSIAESAREAGLLPSARVRNETQES
jgi:large subunit ribosomal protein L18